MKSLYKMVMESDYPKKEIYHHYSDLYIFVTPLTTRLVNTWCKVNGFSKGRHCPIFKDQITGRLMYDCAFCYEPYWEAKDKWKLD